ncbi:Ubiquinone biosynthesis O-methyltransferase [ANME-1 cluster archaeon GoMg3.2]|nr:Ubiquinone biosynthesis O-methyltransferase [ANME-1 cluster archaeon GoMg3.2]
MRDNISSKKAEPPVWNTTWSKSHGKIQIGEMDIKIFNEINKAIDITDKEVIELGCGRGVLSYLMLKYGASKVTLVDFSKEALSLARSLFKSHENVDFMLSNFFNVETTKTYDIVLSSGVAEHFSGELRKEGINKHLTLSKDIVLIIAPARPHYNTVRHKKRRTIELYGWQRAFSKKEIKALIEETGEFKVILNRRFYPLYGIDTYELLSFDTDAFIFKYWNFIIRLINAILYKIKIYTLIDFILRPAANYCGGLLITVAVKNKNLEKKQ